MSGIFDVTILDCLQKPSLELDVYLYSTVVTNPNDSNDPTINNILTCNFIASTMTFNIFEIMEDTINAKLGVCKE